MAYRRSDGLSLSLVWRRRTVAQSNLSCWVDRTEQNEHSSCIQLDRTKANNEALPGKATVR
jgi:hypothetical protein